MQRICENVTQITSTYQYVSIGVALEMNQNTLVLQYKGGIIRNQNRASVAPKKRQKAILIKT